MICADTLKFLLRKLDNDLTDAEEKILQEHLENCSLCAQEAEEILLEQKKIKEYYQAVPQLDSQFIEKLMGKINLEKKKYFLSAPWFKAASFLLVLGLLTVSVLSYMPQGKEKKKEKMIIKEDNIVAQKAEKRIKKPKEESDFQSAKVQAKKIKDNQVAMLTRPEKASQDMSREKDLPAQAMAFSIPNNLQANNATAMMMRSSQVKMIDAYQEEPNFVSFVPNGYQLLTNEIEKNKEGQVQCCQLTYTAINDKNKQIILKIDSESNVKAENMPQQFLDQHGQKFFLSISSNQLSKEEKEQIITSFLTENK